MKPRRYWTDAESEQLRVLYPDFTGQVVADRLGRDVRAVYQKARALGLAKSETFLASDLSGRIQRGRTDPRLVATQIKPGATPWNKGTHYVAGGRSAETRFKPGTRPHTWRPIGSFRISKDGYLQRKESDTGYPPRDWVSVHRAVWEAVHGPIPPKHLVVFRPGMRTNVLQEITVDRLECISMAENAQRNHPRSRNPELARLVQLKGAITRQVNRIAKESQQ